MPAGHISTQIRLYGALHVHVREKYLRYVSREIESEADRTRGHSAKGNANLRYATNIVY